MPVEDPRNDFSRGRTAADAVVTEEPTELPESGDNSAEANGEPERVAEGSGPEPVDQEETGGEQPAEAKAPEAAAEQPLTPEAVIEQLRAEVEGANDKYLRALADQDNARKRARRDLQEALRYATWTLMAALLPVVDSLERALDSSQSAEAEGQLREGVELTLKQLTQVLEKHGMIPVPALGERFDPTKHEALGQVETADAEPGCIVLEALKGYCLHDRVLRASQVFVAAVSTPAEAGAEAAPDSEAATSDDETA